MDQQAEPPMTGATCFSCRSTGGLETERGDDSSPASVMESRRDRVLLLNSSFPYWAGSSTTHFTLNLAQDLRALGWRIVKRPYLLNGHHGNICFRLGCGRRVHLRLCPSQQDALPPGPGHDL